MTRRISTRGIIYKDDGLLLCQKLTRMVEGETRTWWCIPGGGLEAGESLHEGLHRELIEETGIAPKIGRLLFIQQFSSGDQEHLEFFFHIENPQDYTVIDLAATTHGALESDEISFVTPSEHNLLPSFIQTIDLKDYIENNKSVYIYNELADVAAAEKHQTK